VTQFAVWFVRYGSAFAELYDDEEAAAMGAVSMQDQNWASVQGVQYEDGSYLPIDSWPAFAQEMDDRAAELTANRLAEDATPPPETREVVPPFGAGNGTATVLVDAPAWLGAPPDPPPLTAPQTPVKDQP
jgi:hypothetical protein